MEKELLESHIDTSSKHVKLGINHIENTSIFIGFAHTPQTHDATITPSPRQNDAILT